MATKIIALDAGHGLKTPGKQTPDGIKEWLLNDKVRDKVVEMLKDYDVEFVFPDNDEGNIDEGNTARRIAYVNQKVDVIVSIHHNAYKGIWCTATGLEAYVDRNATAADLKLAECIYSRMVANIGLKGRGIKRADFTVINQNSIPAILTEGGFMDNKKDYAVITSDAGQTAYAKAIAEGLIEFLELEKKVTVKPTTTTVKPEEVAMKKIKRGSTGKAVRVWQTVLGYTGADIDGKFGPQTEKDTIAFQKKAFPGKANEAEWDGVVGPNTWKAGLESVK